MTKKFIDISNHNTLYNYTVLKNFDLECVIIKATEGTTFVDPLLESHYKGAKDKIPVGFYHYLTVTSDPKTQAVNFWNTIKGKEFQVIPVLDVEQVNLGSQAEEYSQKFIQCFRDISGLDMIVYSYRCYIEEYFSQEFRANNVWWVADYGTNITPYIKGCNIIAWQYTDSSPNYPFIKGDVDCNLLINESKFYIEIPYSEEGEEIKNNDYTVLWLQKTLNQKCYTDKNWDELVEDGIAGELTLSACPLIAKGTIDDLVKFIQFKVDVIIDGIFGEKTRQAVIQYQEDRSLDGDGIVGKRTWRKMIEL